MPKYTSLFLFALFSFLILPKAFAFDRMSCQSQLKDWNLYLNNAGGTSRSKIGKPENSAFAPTEKESAKFVIKNSKHQLIATIFPWNTLYVRKSKSMDKEYTFKQLETALGFQIEIVNKVTKDSRTIDCKFTL